ncbi:MAG: restriction endonuclease subunit S [Polyangia bacterium]
MSRSRCRLQPRRLAEVAEVVTGTTPSTSCPEYYGGEVPFVGPAELGDTRPIESARKTLSAAGAAHARLVPAGSVLVCCIGSIGKTGFAGCRLATNQQINALIFDPKQVFPRYGFYYLRSLESTLRAQGKSTTVSILPKYRFQELPLLIPPLSEQRRITDLLDRADAIRRKRAQSVALVGELLRSAALELFGDPVTNPRGWPTVRIEDLCDRIVDCVNKTAPTVDSVTPYKMIRTTNVRSGQIRLDDAKYVTQQTFAAWNRRCVPRPGDVILTREAPVGEAGILLTEDPVFLGQRLVLYRPKPERLLPEYLVHALQGQDLQEQFAAHGAGSTVKHLALPVCRALQLRVPPLSLQRRFAELARIVHKKSRRYEQARDESDSLFQSLLGQAFAQAAAQSALAE